MSDAHSGMGRHGGTLAGSLGDVPNTLLLSPQESTAKHDACADVLRDVSVGDAALLGVVSGDAGRFLGHLRRQFGRVPASTTVVAFAPGTDGERAKAGGGAAGVPAGSEECDRDSRGASDGAAPSDDGSIAATVDRVTADEDAGVPTRVRERVNASAGESAHLCFDSVSGAIDVLGRQRTFTFLDSLTTQCAEAGVTAHYHVDPDRHGDQTLEALLTLFDAVATAPDGEEWEIVWRKNRSREEPRG